MRHPPAAVAVLFALLAAAPAASAAERLLIPEMPGWKVIETHTDAVADVSELIPANETPDTWTRRFTIQAFRGSTMTAAAFLDGVVARTDEVCDGIAAEPVRSIVVPGAEAARRGIGCSRYKGDGKGSYTLFTAVRGARALYVLSRAWRGEPYHAGVASPVPAAELAEWTATADSIRLCDSDDSARPCPRALP